MPRGIQNSSKRDFIKKGKIHQAQKGTSASRQEKSLENASKGPKSIKLRKTRREKCPQNFIQSREKKRKEKKVHQTENPKGQSRQKLGPKKKEKEKKIEACQAENPKGRSRQKLGPKKKKKRSPLG